MRLYHTTWKKSARRIQALGLRTCQTSNWTDLEGKRKGGGAIYAFAERTDAIRWAHHMEWEYVKMSGIKLTVIVTIEGDESDWERDPNDVLTQASYGGDWLRCWHNVPSSQIVAVETVTPKMLRSIVMKAVKVDERTSLDAIE